MHLEALAPPPVSPVTLRFRSLALAMLSLDEPVSLDSHSETEAQFRVERPGKPPSYFVLLDGARYDKGSLKLRLAALTAEAVGNQTVVILSNQTAWPDFLKSVRRTHALGLHLAQIDSEGEALFGRPTGLLKQALAASSSIAPVHSPEDFASRLAQTAADKQAQLERFEEQLSSPVATFVLAASLLLCFAAFRLWATEDKLQLAQLQFGFLTPHFVREGEPWRLLSYGFLHDRLLLVGLNAVVLLSMGYPTERIVGTGRFLLTLVLSLLAAGLAVVLPGKDPLLPRVLGFSPALFGILGTLAGLAFWCRAMPAPLVDRLRKTAFGGLIPAAILLFLIGERVALLCGFAMGLVLVVVFGRVIKPGPVKPARHALTALMALSLASCLGAAWFVGQPWSKTPTRQSVWLEKLGALGRVSPNPGGVVANGKPSASVPNGDGTVWVTHSVEGAGVSLKLPPTLGSPQKLTEGPQATFRFGDLQSTMQQLDVAVRRHEQRLKKASAVLVAFDQVVALTRADRQREINAGRLRMDGEPRRFEVAGHPAVEWTFTGLDGNKARTAVLVNKQFLIVLSYLHAQLLPERLQLDLAQVLASAQDEFADSPVEQKKHKKNKRR